MIAAIQFLEKPVLLDGFFENHSFSKGNNSDGIFE